MLSAQNNNTSIRAIKLAIVLFVIVFVLWSANKIRLQIETSVVLHRNWRVNVALQTNPIVVLSIPKDENDQLSFVTIPGNVSAKVPFGYGPYRLEAVWRLGQLESKPELFVETVENMLGIKINGWIGSGETIEYDQNMQDLFRKKIVQQIPLLQVHNKTNLNTIDRFLIYLALKRANSTNMRTFATHLNPQLFADSELPDSSPIKIVNETLLEKFLEQKFEDTKVRSDNLSVKLFNTTDIPNIGKRFARFVSQFGGKIITVANEKKSVQNCLILVSNANKDKKLVQYLRTEFLCEITITESLGDADVALYIGNTLVKKLQD